MGGHPHSVSGAPWVPEARFLWQRLGLAPADLDRKSREPRWGGGDSDLAVLAKPAVGSKPVGGAGHPRKTAVFRWVISRRHPGTSSVPVGAAATEVGGLRYFVGEDF